MIEIIAHRGFSAIAPENTLAAFDLAIEHGANSIEFDVQLSREGLPVIFHDTTLDRITQTSGKVRDKTLEELKMLDAGAWFSKRFSGEKIPTLKEALTILKNVDKFLYFDVKPHCEWSNSEVEDFVNTLTVEGVKHKSAITSFNDKFLEQVREISGDLLIGHIIVNEAAYRDRLAKTVTTGDRLISSQYRVLLDRPSLIESSRDRGVDVVAWTVDSREDVVKLVDIGVVRIVTNSLIGNETKL
ncbi:glycerophosphodiester phosphodiesterase family protein [Kamptonema sp. UHCC 0994]|uniref:glycerophosphodiester phosphodiesterase n=1 Tax=Kamptonema sp. UHCC 0994 TaxID=3031329 RepID=UPI0023BA17B4|nr:glycerophosphodiester phosphodiesterase family protein [Kamptonema sp. UHCC 0994]MDF0554315.1 glycerophosphodiester phosphodiesterase family protein [Kamptonema sp. UHCC 0994]